MKNQLQYWIKIGFSIAFGIVFLATVSIDFSSNSKGIESDQSIAQDQKTERPILILILREIDTVTFKTIVRHPWILERIKKIDKSSLAFRKMRINYRKYLYGKDMAELRKRKQQPQLPLPLIEYLYLSQNQKRK